MKTEKIGEKVTITMTNEEYEKLGVLVSTGISMIELTDVVTKEEIKQFEKIYREL